MAYWTCVLFLFAEGEQQQQVSPLVTWMPMIMIGVLFYVLILRPQKREQASREAMLAALKKNDRVVTIGGMIGEVANISADGQEVTLKVDDNTRVRMVRSSIQRIMTNETDGKTAENK